MALFFNSSSLQLSSLQSENSGSKKEYGSKIKKESEQDSSNEYESCNTVSEVTSKAPDNLVNHDYREQIGLFGAYDQSVPFFYVRRTYNGKEKGKK